MKLKNVEIEEYFDLLYWTKVETPINIGQFHKKSR